MCGIVTLNGWDGVRIHAGDEPSPVVTASGLGRAHGNREVALVTCRPGATQCPETGKDLRLDSVAIGRAWGHLIASGPVPSELRGGGVACRHH